MAAFWTFPWTLFEEGASDAAGAIVDRGIDTIAVAAHYHSVQAMQPRTPEALFERYPGGCYFDPDPDRFAGTPIDPPVNEVAGTDDPLADAVAAADEHDLSVAGWIVLMHNSRLGHDHPRFRLEDAFGTDHEHALCPSNPEVREYFAAVAGAVADRGVAEIQLESYGFQNVFHGHDTQFGHEMHHVLTSDVEEALLSQCFCDACRRRASEHGIDPDRARDVVQSILSESFRRPHSNPPPLSTLVRERPVLGDLLDVRANVVTDLVAAIDDAVGDVPLNGYVPGAGGKRFRGGWPGGVRLDLLEEHLDRVTAYCYVDEPAAARDRIRTLQRRTDLPVDAGVTLTPGVIDGAETLAGVIEATESAVDGRTSVYNYGLATEAQLDWVEAAFDGR